LPQAPCDPPIVAFGVPGAGYNRSYFTFDMPGGEGGGEAGWHARRGWVFVSVDSLGVGEGVTEDAVKLPLAPIVAANHATAREVLARLAEGRLAEGFAPLTDPVVLGFGQSMGGGLTILQQAHHDTFDGIGVLGFSAVYTTARGRPGGPPPPIPFIPRDYTPADPTTPEGRAAGSTSGTLRRLQRNPDLYVDKAPADSSWNFHYDDVDAEVRAQDFDPKVAPPWRSATIPSSVYYMLAPGSLGPEAAAIVVPVLSAFGERDVVENPRDEHKAFRHAVDFSAFICPRMGHMHNFATTRELLWSRIDHWGRHVAELKRRLPHDWPAGLFSDSY
jgi:hypothetical protein